MNLYNIRINKNSFQQPKTNKFNPNIRPNGNFEQVLQQKINQNKEVKFSKHALERLEQRNIHLTPQDIAKINEAVDLAAKKGVKDTLVLMNNRVFVVNVNSKTVITASEEEQLKENVFTNIDGAVIV